MPVMGGLEAVRILRENKFENPIVALTANAMQEEKDACFNAGCNGFLTKPIDTALLNKTISTYLDAKIETQTQQSFLVSTLLKDDPGSLKLIKRFVEKIPASLKQVEEMIEISDWKNLSDKLHEIKGTGGNYGYPDIHSIAEKMENKVKDKNSIELNKLLSELKVVNEQILSGLENS